MGDLMSGRKDIRSSAALYRGFREEPPQRARQVKIKVPHAVAVMGQVEFIGYVRTARRQDLPVHPPVRARLASGVGSGRRLQQSGVPDRWSVPGDGSGGLWITAPEAVKCAAGTATKSM